MSLAPGRTRDIYQLVSSTGLQDTSQAVSAHSSSAEGSDTESVTNITTTQVVIQSLAGRLFSDCVVTLVYCCAAKSASTSHHVDDM
jgi:hypothetical protein